jgi:hypothetical protein
MEYDGNAKAKDDEVPRRNAGTMPPFHLITFGKLSAFHRRTFTLSFGASAT